MLSIELNPDATDEDLRIASADNGMIRNVTRPTLTAFLPETAGEGPAVIVCPGGGFHMLSLQNEGHELAKILAAKGIPAYVLEYRLIQTPVDESEFFTHLGPLMADLGNPVELTKRIEDFRPTFRADGCAAVGWVRERHSKVAMVGFSAGGMLTADLIGLEDAACRPDVAGLIYTPFGVPPQAPDGAPPIWVLAASDDPFGIAGSYDLDRVWTAAGVPVEMHLFPVGGHGFGVAKTGHPVDVWPDLLLTWLASQGVS